MSASETTARWFAANAQETIRSFMPDAVAIRRDLHRHPELGLREHRTAAIVAEHLRAWGLDEVHTGVGGTGVVGVLRGRRAGDRAIALRADMDGLPIDETSGLDHASTVPGVMHACGHDGHVTMLLMAARYLAGSRAFSGTICFFFQPAEESLAGARAMIDDGLFKRFPVDRVYGLHNWPSLPLGTVGVRPGPIMAARDDFWVQIHGKGTHGAYPDHGTDSILAAAQLITALQSIVSRNIPAADSAVLTVHSIVAGSTIENGRPTQSVTIPALCQLAGIVKCYTPTVQTRIEKRLRLLVDATAAAMETRGEVTYLQACPPVVNDREDATRIRQVAGDLLGEQQVVSDIAPAMASEDFAFMLQHRPGAYFWLGTGTGCSLHNPNFDFNDEAIPIGAALLADLARSALDCP